MDKLSKKRRSEIMSLVRGKNTSPELTVRSLIHRLGYRYRIHSKKLPGRPDLVFAGRKKVIFVHGCFWHSHKGCPKGKLPKSNLDYWKPKMRRNKKRDLENQQRLESEGWDLLIVWQCELKDIETLKSRVVRFLKELSAKLPLCKRKRLIRNDYEKAFSEKKRRFYRKRNRR